MSRAQLTSTVEQSSGGVVAPFLAGKNKIINGDFAISQRGNSFSQPTGYTLDRWTVGYYDAYPTTVSISQQAFTPGSAPVAGYEAPYFARCAITTVGSTTVFEAFVQKIENVQTLAGQTATLSFWAKGDSSRTAAGIIVGQAFGTGGSSFVSSYITSTYSVTSTWTRYSYTFTVPSIAGKTIGAGSSLNIYFRVPVASGATTDIWGVQLEAGSVATPFTTASGTLQGELALCQRYFCTIGQEEAWGQLYSTTDVMLWFKFPVAMRIAPTATYPSLTNAIDRVGSSNGTPTSLGTNIVTANNIMIIGHGMAAGTAYMPAAWYGNAGANLIQISAEL